MAARDTTGYNNQSKQNMAGAKLLAVGEINVISSGDDTHATVCAAATPQEIMYSPTGNFGNQGGASLDAIVTPFQIGGSSTKLPTMPTTADSGCVVSQSNQVDPPVTGWTPPVINISYLNPFKRPSDPAHGQGEHYDGTILFNGGSNTNQNLINSATFPEDLRPMALRGPLVVQGWGYDLNGKPIPNKEDDETDAQEGTFKTDDLKDEFLDDWIEKRETWPVAPVDLRYDRLRKVWTVPNGFRIIQVQVTGAEGVLPGTSNPDCTPLNISKVYDEDGDEIDEPKVIVTNPLWNVSIASGESFYAFYDTKDCTYYPIALSGSCDPVVTGAKDITVAVSESGGCKTYTVSGCNPTVVGRGGTTVTPQTVSGCMTYIVSGSPSYPTPCTAISGLGDITVVEVGACDYTISGCNPVVTGVGNMTVAVSETGGCKTYTVSGCDPTFTGLGSITVENTGECNYTISGCAPKVTGEGDTTVTLATVDGCDTYTVSSCDPKVTGIGGTEVTLATVGGCDTYTVSSCETSITGIGGITTAQDGECSYTISGCDITITGAGGVTTTKDGECGYTISGCEATVTGGTGIEVKKDGCDYTINYDGCHTIVGEGDNCIVVADSMTTENCHEYLLSLDTDCVNNFVNPHWSLCGSAVSSGENITFTASTSGCGTVTCDSSNVVIHSPKTSITGLGSITTTEDGECGYTISGCAPKVTGIGGTEVTLATVGGCDTYTVSGACETAITGIGSITTAENGDCSYTISGCDPTFVQAGTVTITSTEVGGCKAYTISGIPAGGGGGEAQYSDTSYCTYVGTASCSVIPCLTFGEGLQLAGDTVSSPLLEVDGTHTVCNVVAAGAAGATKITFGENVKVTKAGCEFEVQGMDQHIRTDGEGPECMPPAWKDNILNGADFQQLTFADNIGVKADGNCSYTIRGLDQKIQGTLADPICGLANVGTKNFAKLIFADNIGVVMGDAPDCEATIKGMDQKIEGTWVDAKCGNADAVGVGNFKHLKFADNTILTNNADCSWTIKGLDQKIEGTWAPAAPDDCGAAAVPPDTFKHLKFADNTILTNNDDCTWTIKGLDQKIEGTWVLAPDTCGTAVVPVGNFKHLKFGDNTIVTKDGNCVYTIKGVDQKVESTLTDTLCGVLKNTGPKDFKKLLFTSNIGVEVADCIATIQGLNQKIQATQQLPCLPDSETYDLAADRDFTTLIFSDNIGVDLDGCEATIMGLDQTIAGAKNDCIPDSGPVDATFKKLTFGANLGVDNDDAANCHYTIKGLDQKVKSLAAGYCNDGDNNPLDFTTLAFRHGFSVDHVGCTATIDKVLKVHNAAGLEQEDNVCSIKMGCGMDATVGGAGGEVILKLKDKFFDDAVPPAPTNKTVRFVSDICCVGQGLDVKHMTMTFSSCGQLIAVDDDDYCDG